MLSTEKTRVERGKNDVVAAIRKSKWTLSHSNE